MTRHLSHQESLHSVGAFNNAAALKGQDVSTLPNNTWAYVDTDGEYCFDIHSSAAESLPDIIAPNTGSGRWIKKKLTTASDFNLLKMVSGAQNLSTTNVPEGSNLYFTEQRVLDTDLAGFAADNSAIVSSDTVLSGLSKAQGQLDNKLNLSGGTLSGLLTLASDPTSPFHAATKQYVDNIVQGLNVKASVRAATTANITLSGTQTIDGIALNVNDRVLVKNQSTASQNGIYSVQSGTWTRALDFDVWTEIPGSFTFVEEGLINNATGWVCSSAHGGTLNTTNINFVLFSSAGAYTADGHGLVLFGNQFSLQLDSSTLSKSGTGLKVAAGGITNTEIASNAAIDRTKIAYGSNNHVIVNDGAGNLSSQAVLDVSKGGTGLSTSGSANQLLGANSGATGLEYKTIAFTNGSVTHSANTITLGIPQPLSSSSTPTFGGLTLNSALNLPADPVNPLEAATKQYVDSNAFTEAKVRTTVLTGMAPVNSSIAATDSLITGISKAQGQINNKLNLSGGTLTGTLTLNADPANALDAATKQYVDNLVQGLDVKASVRVATTANITLSGTQIIDGISVIANDRVLVKNQTTASQNGIYLVQAGAWTRTTDFNAWAKLPGAFTFVEDGTVNKATGWVCSNIQGGILDTTNITFILFSSAGAYTADGLGLILSGSQFSIQLDSTTLSKSASGLKVATGGIANNEISGTAAISRSKIATGPINQIVVNDGSGNLSSVASLDISKGGTGLTTVAGANQLLGANSAGTGLEYKTIGATNIKLVNAANSLTFSIPQSVATTASPTFEGMTLNGTGSLKVPAGTTAQRPGTTANGMIRYNTSNFKMEAFENGAWINMITGSTNNPSIDYSFQFTLPNMLVAGQVAGIGTNGGGFATVMGFPIPVGLTIVEIGIVLGTYGASAASNINVSVRELNTNSGAGVSTQITGTAGTVKATASITSATSVSTVYYKTFQLTGLSAALTAGNMLFATVDSLLNCSATDMVLYVRCKLT